jgi:hypothetical protein
MAFDKNNLSRTGGTAPAPILYTYVTNDPRAQVTGQGYFNGGYATFRVDDTIIVTGNDGTYRLRVVSVGTKSVQTKIIVESSDMPLTGFGDLRTAELTPQFQGSFEYTVDNTQIIEQQVANSATITQADAMAVLTTDSQADSTARMRSYRHARYRSGLGGLVRFTALFNTPIAGTEQYVGIMDETGSSEAFLNGLAVGYDGTTFGFHRWANDALVTVEQSQWDDPLDGTGASGMVLDQTKLNVFAIQYKYLGAGSIKLFLEDEETGLLIKVHELHFVNQTVVPHSYNPNYHFTMWVNNGSSAEVMNIKSASFAYFIEGKTRFFEIHQPLFDSGKVEVASVTAEVPLFTIRNKTTYAGKPNFIDVVLQKFSAAGEASSANNLAEVRIVINANLTGSPSFSDINATDSVVEIDTSASGITGGRQIFGVPLAGKNDKVLEQLNGLDILLQSGETLTVLASSANNATINAALLWRELF